MKLVREVRALCLASVFLAISAPVTMAQALVTTSKVSAALANEMVGETVRACAAQGYAVTATLLDMDGVRQALLRGDGAGIQTLDSAYAKAFTAVSAKRDTAQLVEDAKSHPVSAIFAKHPNMILAQGGVVIRVGKDVIGAIGVSGGPGGGIDSGCAQAALAKVASRLR